METIFYHNFNGYNIHSSCCVVKIISENDKHLICFEDINDGTSVTNASEQLAAEIIEKMEYDPSDCRFFETYKQYDYDTFDEIIYDWEYVNGVDHRGYEYFITFRAKYPKWTPAPKKFKNMFLNINI